MRDTKGIRMAALGGGERKSRSMKRKRSCILKIGPIGAIFRCSLTVAAETEVMVIGIT